MILPVPMIKTYHMFHESDLYPRTEVMLNFISSIWEDDRIEKLENNQWNCFWFVIPFREINDTKALDGVIGIRGMHIKSYNDAIDKSNISIYKDLHK